MNTVRSHGFRIVHESVDAKTPAVARIRDRTAAKVAAIDPRPGALSGTSAEAACFVATGMPAETGARCKAMVDSVSGFVLAASVVVGFDEATVASGSHTEVLVRGTIVIDARTHTVLRASFSGVELFELRTVDCAPSWFCPFENVGSADVATSYER